MSSQMLIMAAVVALMMLKEPRLKQQQKWNSLSNWHRERFGIPGKPKITKEWNTKKIKDDPVRPSNRIEPTLIYDICNKWKRFEDNTNVY
mmetsp:Transcript_1750/g.2531  ORF Transcript_1750/g.2531 Transcript_1750/m.2531 type:complete len:90 (+) Transcript_1750:153-422(+)